MYALILNAGIVENILRVLRLKFANLKVEILHHVDQVLMITSQ